jgi:hypothetical protein
MYIGGGVVLLIVIIVVVVLLLRRRLRLPNLAALDCYWGSPYAARPGRGQENGQRAGSRASTCDGASPLMVAARTQRPGKPPGGPA